MKYYLVVGETSGDMHAANLMKAILQKDKEAEFRFRGGDAMLKVSKNIHRHISEFSVMGFINVLLKMRAIMKDIKDCKNDIEEYAPDVLILLDFPGYNMRIAKWAKEKGFKVVYFILPKVWAWNTKRAYTLAQNTDLLLSILPFEKEFYQERNIPIEYVGNPLIQYTKEHSTKSFQDFVTQQKIEDKPIIAILPGSRKQELKHILPTVVKSCKHFGDYQFVIGGAPNLSIPQYRKYIQNDIPVIFNATYDLLQHATAAIVASGTATLETALLGTPQLVVYRGPALSIKIAKFVAKVKFISLVNIILDREAVKEFIQEDCSEVNVVNTLHKLLNDKAEQQIMKQNYKEISSIIGNQNTVDVAAKKILELIK